MKERVQKLMAQANIGSRRACEALIEQRRVRVNGEIITLGDQADPAVDVIEVDGNRLDFETIQQKIYIALNKPRNVVSTNKHFRGEERRTVRELVPVEGHLFTVGRLDADSEGLIVLTNDGDLANRVSHPRYEHTKTYKVTVAGLPSLDTLNTWQRGVQLDEETKTAPCYVKIMKGSERETVLRVVLTEGKKRQIRRIAAMLGHPVVRLIRTHVGRLELGTLRSGEWRELNAREVELLRTPASELREIREMKKRQSRPRRGPAGEGPKRPFKPKKRR